ncbi:MAG TPA: L-2-hydroxyglutarate oxidase [Bacteroidia bacterium]|nr:L-2-hydroxyglutarate oxidase [Bacteroidia bacterium]
MRYDIVIIGGGIVGLATAYQLKKLQPGLKTAVVEKGSTVGNQQTGHNSGVIHSGLYYKPGSLKAKNCINGYTMLLDFCNEHGIKYELCGKIVVATQPEELPLLENLYKRGLENGLDKIRMIGPEEVKNMEPHVTALKAIDVPYTGIIDYVEVCEKLAELFKANDGEVFLGERVTGIIEKQGYSVVKTTNNELEGKLVINCAGLYSDKVAMFTQENLDTRIIPFRGEYYMLKDSSKHLVKNLIYPVPDPNFPFLGVHFTRMIGGGVEAGPNAVFAFAREGYKKSTINLKELFESLAWPGFQKVIRKYWRTGMGEMYRSFSKRAFTKALQRLIPEIKESDLVPAEAGVRAQACDRTGGLLDDFKIVENNLSINILNAPSPAATSSLSIGKTVAEMAVRKLV